MYTYVIIIYKSYYILNISYNYLLVLHLYSLQQFYVIGYSSFQLTVMRVQFAKSVMKIILRGNLIPSN